MGNCLYCEKTLPKRNKKYCSLSCASKSKNGNTGKISLQCPQCNKEFTVRVKSEIRKYCSIDCANQVPRPVTEAMRKNGRKNGGYKKGSGRGKSGWFSGIWCDSSWELAVVYWCKSHNIPIERNKVRYKYMYENKECVYIPDFYIDGQLTEIKAVWTDRERAKINQCNNLVNIISRNEIQPYLNYVTTRVGKNFCDKLYGVNKDD